MRFQRNFLFVGVLGILLSGCQTSTVSLSEAKKISASFEGKAFTPPPKTIEDITAILNIQKVVDKSEIEAHKAMIKQKPSANASSEELVDFYWRHRKAAEALGLEKIAHEDSARAYEHLMKTNQFGARTRSGRVIWGYAFARLRRGYYADAIKIVNKGIEDNPKNLSFLGERLTDAYIKSGDLESAEELIERTEERNWKVINSRRAKQFRISLARRSNAIMNARLLQARGKWRQAEEVYRQAIEEQKNLMKKVPEAPLHIIFNLQGDIALNLARQGRLLEAEVFARRSLIGTLSTYGKFKRTSANVVVKFGRILNAQGRHADAVKIYRETLSIFRKMGFPEHSLDIGKARVRLAKALAASGDWNAAKTEYAGIENTFKNNKVFSRQYLSEAATYAEILIRSGRAAEAVGLLRGQLAKKLKRFGKKHGRTAKTAGILAIALNNAGDQKQALAMFRQAVPILLRSSRRSDEEESARASSGRQKGQILDSYIHLLADITGKSLEKEARIDAAAEAFRIADVARSRSVQGALAASGARAAAKNADLADLVRREQDAQKQISALFALLADALSAPTDQQDKGALTTLRTNIDGLRSARAALAEEIEKRFPDYADLINPQPSTIALAQKALRSGEALVSTYVSHDKTFIWAVPKNGKTAFASAPLGVSRLVAVVKGLRRSLDPKAATLGDIPDFDISLSYRLFRALLEPVKAGWEKSNSLLVVADGALGQLPLSVLVTRRTALPNESGALFTNYKGVPWLARSHSVTVLPSVASLASLRALPRGNPKRKNFIGFGDPYFNAKQAAQGAKPIKMAALTSRGALNVRGVPVNLRSVPQTQGLNSADLGKLPRLPDTADEVRSIALAMNADLTRDVLTGARATESAVKQLDLSGYRVLAFATHGLIPGDLNGLHQPALALTSPKLRGGGGDGLLTMGEILSLRLDADWVVLSACNTAAGDGAGAEAFSGLGRAFFYAGTRALLLSNWPVETTSARALTTDLFRRQAKNSSLTRARALQLAMLNLIDGEGYIDPASKKIVFSYAHPIFWAPFSLVGDGGGGKPAS
jgi:CHAT domain-containing protein